MGVRLQAARRFERWVHVIYLELASLFHKQAMLLMTLQLALWFSFVLTPCTVLSCSN